MQNPFPQSQQMLARAFAAHQAGNIGEAELLYKLVLQTDKKQFDALHMLGVIEAQRGNFPASLARLNEALRLRPKSADALINLGRVQSELGHRDDAIATYRKALTLDPQSALAHSNMSIVLREAKQCDEALAHCDAALRIAPNYPDAWNNRGNVLFDLKRYDAALADYDRAIALNANHAQAHLGRGNALSEIQRDGEALAAFDRAIAIDPNHAEAWLARGKVLFGFKRYEAALAAFDRALALNPDLADAWLNRANVFAEFKRYEEALAAFDKALQIDPDIPYVPGHRLHVKLNMCDWANIDAEISALLSKLREGKPVSISFPILSLPSTPADQLQAARGFVSTRLRFPPLAGARYSHDRIRIAYASSDFGEHAVGYLTVGLFEHHDRSRFETVAISFDAKQDSAFRQRIQRSFEHFIDASTFSDEAAAHLVRQQEIDILVDLNGWTRNGRRGVFARRPAPLQVNYLGYPGTMGADYYDYIVADSTVVPQQHFAFYSEQVAWLPDTFMIGASAHHIGEQTPPRSALGLPEDGFVFQCFNQSYKIDPPVFDVWMRLLQAVDGSVLWLKDNHPVSTRNLRGEAERRGIAPERLVFAPSVDALADHLARQRQADLFLDTLYYNAHTTAVDALAADVPVVTCLGAAFPSRVAASLLGAAGLPELVTHSLPDYEALALKLAHDRTLLAALKARLSQNRGVFPLFDLARFTRNIERAYVAMWERAQRGERPHHFAVPPA
jgi:predicted O-linked N-acetylglucosamine transferase (SPINDLY family)